MGERKGITTECHLKGPQQLKIRWSTVEPVQSGMGRRSEPNDRYRRKSVR